MMLLVAAITAATASDLARDASKQRIFDDIEYNAKRGLYILTTTEECSQLKFLEKEGFELIGHKELSPCFTADCRDVREYVFGCDVKWNQKSEKRGRE